MPFEWNVNDDLPPALSRIETNPSALGFLHVRRKFGCLVRPIGTTYMMVAFDRIRSKALECHATFPPKSEWDLQGKMCLKTEIIMARLQSAMKICRADISDTMLLGRKTITPPPLAAAANGPLQYQAGVGRVLPQEVAAERRYLSLCPSQPLGRLHGRVKAEPRSGAEGSLDADGESGTLDIRQSFSGVRQK